MLSLAAFKCFAVNETFKVEYCCIALLKRSVCNVDDSCILLLISLELVCNIFVSYILDSLVYLYTLIVLDFNFGLCCKCSLERNAVLLAYFCYFDVGHINNFKLKLVDNFRNALLVHTVNSIFIENAFAVLSLDYLTGCLTLSEAGNVYVLFLL